MGPRSIYRTLNLKRRVTRSLRIAAIAGMVVGATIAGWPAAAMASSVGVQAQNAATSVSVAPTPCSPENDTGDNDCAQCPPEDIATDEDDCPPPVIPEAPMAALLPLGAGGLFAAAYIYIRRRNGAEVAG